jgi:DNA-directed RNA polymerase specialized sigma24 family protein
MLEQAKALPDNKVAWTLNSSSFDKLLSALDADRSSAGTAYEQLRLRLIGFFDWHDCAFPEELADETFDRVARRLAEGEFIMNLPNYCFGVARRLLLEVLGRQGLQPALWMPTNRGQNQAAERFYLASRYRSQDSRARELQLAYLEASLQQLAPADRELVLQYYESEACSRVDQRTALAERLGISLATLRVRVYRVREELKRHLGTLLQHDSATGRTIARQQHKDC